jgi:hypothetical protein
MSNINDKIEALRKEFNEKLDALKGEPVEEGWNYGDNYWYINVNGDLNNSMWVDHELDSKRLSLGNAFHTKEEAEKEALRRKMRAGAYLPKNGEDYWATHVNGTISPTKCTWTESHTDDCLYFAGLTRKTKEEMEEAWRLYGKGFEI